MTSLSPKTLSDFDKQVEALRNEHGITRAAAVAQLQHEERLREAAAKEADEPTETEAQE